MNINWLQLLTSFTGSMAFSYLFRLRGKNALIAGIGGGFAWFIYLEAYSYIIPSAGLCTLLASILLGAYAEIAAILTRVPRTVYIAVGIIPLIPGADLYYTLFNLLQTDYAIAQSHAISAVVTAVAIAGGLLMAFSIGDAARYVRQTHNNFRKNL